MVLMARRGERSELDNRRADILLSKHKLLSEVATYIVGDVEQLARIVEILRPIYDEQVVREAFQGTYRGNAAVVVQGALSREAAAIISRLFARPRKKGASIDFEGSDRSLVLAVEIFRKDTTAQKLFDRDSFRWGASGGFSLSENGAARQLSLAEALRRRIRDGKESIRTHRERLSVSVKSVSDFSQSTEYGKIRTFRTEKIAHNVPVSKDREAYKLSDLETAITYDEVDAIAIQALGVAEKSILAMFRRSLSIDDQRDIWSAYARLFWSRAAGVALVNGLQLQEEE